MYNTNTKTVTYAHIKTRNQRNKYLHSQRDFSHRVKITCFIFLSKGSSIHEQKLLTLLLHIKYSFPTDCIFCLPIFLLKNVNIFVWKQVFFLDRKTSVNSKNTSAGTQGRLLVISNSECLFSQLPVSENLWAIIKKKYIIFRDSADIILSLMSNLDFFKSMSSATVWNKLISEVPL